MVPRIILSGGYISRSADGGAAFCAEVVRDLGHSINILECLFALPENAWDNALQKDEDLFRKMLPDTQITFLIAEQSTFIDQIKWADIVYFRGGDPQKLYEGLEKIQGWEDELRSKTVVGTSAGAYILAEFYLHASEMPELRRGFGLTQAKVVAHYRSDFLHKDSREKSDYYWDQVDRVMSEQQKHLEAIKLKEGEFKVLPK